MIEFLFVYMSLLSVVIFIGAVMFLTALALTYVYNLSRLMFNDTWSKIITLVLTVSIIIFYFTLGIYFGEEPI